MRGYLRAIRRSLSFEGELEHTARSVYRKLDERGKSIFVADFEGTTEPMVLVFAKGERAVLIRQRLTDLLDPE